MPKPLVAIVGRPNVGKSTLFNRLVGARVAIVEDIPGTTRDRLYADADWAGREFTLVDTGGLELGPGEDISHLVRQQARLAIEEADVIALMVDARDGLTPVDFEIADVLRRAEKPLVVVANKADSQERRIDATQFYRLGVGDVFPVSALHGTGTGDLLDAIVALLPTEIRVEEVEEVVSVAIVGRPNVGKSSLLNTFLGQDRVVVSEVPGTTRDAIDTLVEHGGRPIMLIDTAGIRRRGRIAAGVERYSVLRALRAIDRSDVALLLIDAVEGVTDQDTHIAGHVREAGKGLAIVVNKWDLVKKTDQTYVVYARQVREQFKFTPWAPILFVSAKTGQRVGQLLDVALRIKEERQKRIPTGLLNQVVADALHSHAPPAVKGKPLKIYYATQSSVGPPTFVFFVNDPKLVHFSYERFLENRIREHFAFEGTPLRLTFRGRAERKE
ncbi:MAG: ribosome biogenesis GTPase Der [Chloroflexi bacterium]|nr:ribosome biogenesis GTPase Der [Chloroflexota bacterium]